MNLSWEEMTLLKKSSTHMLLEGTHCTDSCQLGNLPTISTGIKHWACCKKITSEGTLWSGLASSSYDHQDDDGDDDDDDGPACWLWLSKQVGHKHFEISISSQISPQSSPHSNDTGAVYSGKSDFSKVRESYRLNIKAKNCICWTSPQHSLHSHDHCPSQSSVQDHFKASVFAYFVGYHIVMADLGTKRFSNFGQRHVIVGI